MTTVVLHHGIEFRFFDHLYAVSACARVLRISDLSYATGHKRKDGYISINKRLVHRMIATCWVYRPEGFNHVHHINHDKSDNRAENLEWITPKKHMAEKHRLEVGRYVRTDETKAKISQYRLGTKQSPETKAKIGNALRGRPRLAPPSMPKGSKHKAETKLKMSLSSPKIVACEVDGVRYRSFTEAGKARGERPLTLRKRCHSSNFANYKLLDE